MKRKIEPNQLSLVFQGHLGLIVGPGLTLGEGAPDEISAAVARAFDVDAGQTYLETCDAALTRGNSGEAVRGIVTSAMSSRAPAALSARLARVRWGAVLNFAPDTTLEDLIRSETTHKAFWPPGIIIDAPHIPIPPRVVPLIKILGTSGRDTLVVSKYEYLRSRPRWRNAERQLLVPLSDN